MIQIYSIYWIVFIIYIYIYIHIHAVQQDTQIVLMSEFIQHLYYLDMFRTSPVHHQERFLQAVLSDLLCGNTRTTRHVQPLRLDVSNSTRITTYQSLRIQLVKNAPDDGPMRSETCRANIYDEWTQPLKNFVYLVGLHIYYKMIHGPYNIKLWKISLTVGDILLPFWSRNSVRNAVLFDVKPYSLVENYRCRKSINS